MGARALRQVAVARKWLEDPRVGYDGGVGARAAGGSQALSCVALAGARVTLAEPGRVVCSLRVRTAVAVRAGRPNPELHQWLMVDFVPEHLSLATGLPWVQDAEGRWHAGAIAAVVDCVCSAVVHTVEGAPTATVHYSLSYFSPADRNVRPD
jgi:acyl-coenzyme A thioesterase 13